MAAAAGGAAAPAASPRWTLRLPGFSAAPIEFRRDFWNTRRTLRALWMFVVLSVLVSIIVLCAMLGQGRVRFRAEPQRVAFAFSTVFTCLTVPISIYGIHMHLAHHSKPHIQRHVIRVLWMVPIYALNAWAALVMGLFCANEKLMIVPDAFRQCYEAYTIYSFYRFIEAYIEDAEGLPLADVMAAQPPMRHLFPLRMSLWTPSDGWFDVYAAPPWRMGRDFLRAAEAGIMNYVLVKPLTTALTLICVATGKYGANQFRANVAYPYLIFLDNASQMWALYCLLLVYLNTHRVLAGAQPALKFMCVKGVVFATFWQGVLLSALTYFDVIASLHETWSPSCAFKQEVVVDAVQDFLICIEMLLFALLHAVAFPSREYRDANLPRRAAGARLKHLFDVSDVVEDVQRHAEGVTRDLAASMQQAAGGVRHAAEGVAGTVAGTVRRGASAAGLASSWPAGGAKTASAADLRQPLLDAEFDDADLADAPWLDAAAPPRLPLPQPLPGRPDSRPSSDAGDPGDAALIL